MAEDKVRLGQVVGVYGPGAMLDLPERSVLVMGLDRWDMSGVGTFRPIEEPRLARLLHQRLKEDGRIAGACSASCVSWTAACPRCPER